MADKCVVRNEKYRRGGLNKRERHNERKNMDYQNEDIDPARFPFNVHFKSCEGGYAATFDRMVAEGAISTRGLGQDPHIVDELVFDVNSAYFENHGGYEYAKQFYEEAYRCAVGLIGGEQYVLSAVMHADERNKALSEQAGYDVYHYHLHVAYIPVVEKKVYFRKNNKDPELAGKLKEVISQVSHSKKWPRATQTDENGEVVRNAKGKAVLVNSYSLLQDRFFHHMREAGFSDFERGERGSSAEHLSVLDYKIQQDTARSAALAVTVEQQQTAVTALDKQAAQKQKRLDNLEQKTTIAKKDSDIFADIDKMGETRTMLGDIAVSKTDWKKLSALAKEGQKSRSTIKNLIETNTAQLREIAEQKAKLKRYGEGLGISDSMEFFAARQRAPRRMAETIADIKRQPPERTGQERSAPERKRSSGLEH